MLALASHLHMKLIDVIQDIDARELALWRVVYEVEGFGLDNVRQRLNEIAALTSAAQGIKPRDELLSDPWTYEPPKKMDVDDKLRIRFAQIQAANR